MKLPYQARRRAALTANRPEPLDQVARINALTRNARTTWFALLAALVFVGVTLAGVEPIDFYGVNRATELPLVGVTVPTRLFFLAAPVLTAAIYIYFHLYLIRLFDALGKAPARIGKEPLSEAIAPWLMNDAVLWVRRRNRKEDCAPKRPLDGVSALFNILLAWGFGLIVLGWGWYSAWPARDLAMNAIGGFCLFAAFGFAAGSYITLRETAPKLAAWRIKAMKITAGLTTAALGLGLYVMSYAKADPDSPLLATLDLTGEELIGLPDGWLPYQIARRDFLAVWKAREGLEGELIPEDQARFDEEWSQRRELALADLERPSFDGNGDRINFKDATLIRATLSGLNLSEAQMEGADLSFAQMEGANLFQANLKGAKLPGAQMEEANLREAQLMGINRECRLGIIRPLLCDPINLNRANLSQAQLEGADLSGAQMEGADLSFAQMEGAVLHFAQMEGAVLYFAQMEGAVLSGAQMEGADLSGAQMEGVTFDYSHLTGRADNPNVLINTNLSASTNNGGALRFVDLTSAQFDAQTDFRNAFMDGSVQMPPELRGQLGDQCQSRLDEVLSDEEFYGRWRGWIERLNSSIWGNFVPPEFINITAIPPAPGCTWKTGPMPGAE